MSNDKTPVDKEIEKINKIITKEVGAPIAPHIKTAMKEKLEQLEKNDIKK